MNAISMELGALKDYIKRMEANQNYMLKLIDNLNKKIEKLEGK